MSSKKWSWFVGLAPLCLLLVACDPERKGADNWTGVCIDSDGDGHGVQCAAGADCNDKDPSIYVGCTKCDVPSEGCTCAPGSAPVECADTPQVTGDGTLICKEGTRYCRDGSWSACEGIRNYTAPPPSRISAYTQSINKGLPPDAAAPCGDVCNPDCYLIEDPIELPGGDGGMYSIDSGIAYTSNGGVTLGGVGTDSGTGNPDEVTQVPPCATATDKDCDNIPDSLDPYPGTPPFQSDNPTIFMDLKAGESKSNTFDLNFYLKTADVYFLLDMTGSMDDEKAKLISSLKNGNFLNNPSTVADESADIECSDRDFNGTPDNGLKTLGVTGNIACLIRSSGFGAGWFREVPFSANDNYKINYSFPNFEAYEHRQDIRADVGAVDAVIGALNSFTTRGNQNWAESGGVALSAVATGGPIYMGWDRPGIPKKTCASGWGYPCFREDAMPIVVLITDAPVMNGPMPAQGHLGDESRSTWKPGGTSTGKQPLNYDTTGLGYMSKTPEGTYNVVSGNENYATAYDVGAIDTVFRTFSGDTRGMTADVYPGNLPYYCGVWPTNSTAVGASAGYPDAVFKFKVNDPTKKLTISTRGTRFKPTLAVFPVGAVAPLAVAAASNATAAAAQDLGALHRTRGMVITGNTDPNTFNSGELTADMVSECLRGETYSNTTPDAWFKFTVPTEMKDVSFSADGGDFDAVLGLWEGAPVSPTGYALGFNDRFFTSAAALPSGTAATPGAINGRTVWFADGDTTDKSADYPATPWLDVDYSCANVSGNSRDTVHDFVVSGTSPRTIRFETTAYNSVLGAANFDHVIGLFARPASGGSYATALACNRGGAGSNRALLEQTLAPGTYSLVVRGERNSDSGTYGLLMSDTSTRVACHNERLLKGFSADLRPGVTYYLGVRARTTGQGSGRGPYTVRIGGGMCAYDNALYTARAGDMPYATGAAEIVDATLPAGEYYAVIKGRGDIAAATGDNGRGWYQITFGDASLATNNLSADMPVWGTATSGIEKQLLDRGVRVITVSSVLACSGCAGGATNANTALKQQADIISKNTKAITETQTTRDFDIYNDGSGLGYAIVNAIAKLTNNVAMDVTVRFVAAPDNPSKPFKFVARAIDVPGDSCAPPVDTNGDGIVDTHKGCAPGAVPRFQVTFQNPPAPNNVPLNPAPGSNGGYNMRIEMIADGRYVIDSTPVFIIPEDVVPDPPKFSYDAKGAYVQDIAASCAGLTDRPNWQALAWSDSLPAGTSIHWRLCAGDSKTELDTCQAGDKWIHVASVTPGASCATSSTCPNGYCAGGICHYPVAPAGTCTASTDCGANGVCVTGACAWTRNPISLVPALKAQQNGKAMMRVQVELNANTGRTEAPAVQEFSLRYVCTPGL